MFGIKTLIHFLPTLVYIEIHVPFLMVYLTGYHLIRTNFFQS